MLKRGLFACAVLGMATSAFAGFRIDLRPVQAPPSPDGFVAGSIVDVNVFLVDTGNTQGAIQLRGAFLDYSDSAAEFTYPDPDGAGMLADGDFSWINPFTIGAVFATLPQTSWVYPLPTANPLFQITVPNDGEVQLGTLKVNVGQNDTGVPVIRTLDAMNDDVMDPNFGARVDFGFGGAGDPVTTWRAFTGDLTGGTVGLQVAPEPATLALLGLGAVAAFRRRRTA